MSEAKSGGPPGHVDAVVRALAGYGPNTAVIRYRQDGSVHDWAVGAHPHADTEKTLRAHLERVLPGSQLIAWALH